MEVPEEILLEIFSKLSTKDVFRTSIISRKSYDLLKDVYFQSIHSKHNSSIPSPSTPLFIKDRRDNNNNLIVSMFLGQFHPQPKAYDIFISNEAFNGDWEKNHWYDNDYTIGNSCNGLLCILPTYEQRKQPIIICNPIKQEHVVVPPCSKFGCISRSIGLGYCMKARNHKIVAISDEQIMVYTLGIDCSWRGIGVIYDYVPFLGPVCIGGNLYWIVLEATTWKKYLMLFDVEKEKISMIMNVPTALDSCHFKEIRLMEIGGEIALVGFYDDYVGIWMIDKNSFWLRRHMIKFPRVCLKLKEKYSCTMEIWEKDDDTLAVLIDNVLITYYDKGKEKKRCIHKKIPSYKSDAKTWKLFSGYKPSFVSL